MYKYCKIRYRKIPLYGGRLVIILSNDQEKVSKLVGITKYEYLFAHSAINKYKGKRAFFIVLNFHDEEAITYGHISHEITHTAEFIAEEAGITADYYENEPVAYIAGWVGNEVYKFIRDCGFKVHYL